MDLNKASEFQKKGFEENIKSGVNKYNTEYYVCTFEKDHENPSIRYEERLAEKIMKQKSRALVYKLDKDHKEYEARMKERRERDASDESRKRKNEKKIMKKEKEKIKDLRVEKAKKRLAAKSGQEAMAKKVNDEKKMAAYVKRFLDEPPLFKKHRKMWKKQNNQFIKQRMEEIQKVQSTSTIDEIRQHQELLAELRDKVIHKFDKNQPITKKLDFYNNKENYEKNQKTSSYKDSAYYSGQFSKDYLQDLSKNSMTGSLKELPFKREGPLLGRDEKMFYRLRKGEFESTTLVNNKEKFADPEDGTFIKKDLPFTIEKRKIEEHNELIKQRQEINKSLPSIHLSHSRKIGLRSRKIFDKIKKSQDLEESTKIVTEHKPKSSILSNSTKDWPEAYWNYGHSMQLPKRHDSNVLNKKINFWQKRYESEDLDDGQTLKMLMQEMKAIDAKAQQTERLIKCELEMNKLPLLPRVLIKPNKNVFSDSRKAFSQKDLVVSSNLAKIKHQDIDPKKSVSFKDEIVADSKKDTEKNSPTKMKGDSLESSMKVKDDVLNDQTKPNENLDNLEEKNAKEVSDANLQIDENLLKSDLDFIKIKQKNDPGFVYSTACKAKIGLQNALFQKEGDFFGTAKA